jgi:hypothetical protein
MKALTILVMILRVVVLLALILGIVLWTGNADNLKPVHMILGILTVLTLWVIGLVQGFQKGGSFPLALATFVVGLIVAIVGLYQESWFQGLSFWGIQAIKVIHLLLGLTTIGLGEMIVARSKRRLKATMSA